MKTAFIVVRNQRMHWDEREFGPMADALLEAGYAADKIFVLSAEDAHELAQTVIEAKNFFENVFVAAPAKDLPALRGRVCELLKVPPQDGAVVEAGTKTFFCFPCGTEGAAAVRAEAVPFLERKYSVSHAVSVIRAVGVPAEKRERLAGMIRSGEGLRCFVSEKYGDFRLEILYDDTSSKMRVDEAVRAAAEELRDYTYAIDDTPLNRRALELLKLRGLRLCVAESFTGGNVAARLIEVPGASEVLFESVVAYDNRSKMQRLGVREETLARHGAVSDDTAYEMAVGLLASGNCDVALATTGIAGPASDNTNKPVGLCYIAVGTSESVFVYKYIFQGSREDITERAVNQALFLLCKQIR